MMVVMLRGMEPLLVSMVVGLVTHTEFPILFILWSRRVRWDTTDYATLVLSDGTTSYLNWYGCVWIDRGVAVHTSIGRGVSIWFLFFISLSLSQMVLPMEILFLVVLSELPD